MNESSNGRQSRIKLLPYCPTEPKPIKKVGKKSAIQSKNEVPKSVETNDDIWKISWITEYDSTRQLLDAQSKSIIEKSNEIELLKESNQKQAKLVSEFAKRLKSKNTIIQQLVQQCLDGLHSEKTVAETVIKTGTETYQTR